MTLIPWDYAVRNLGRSRVRLALSTIGSGLVVLLVLTAGAFVRGMDGSLRKSGQAGNVIVLSSGSEESLQRSEIDMRIAGELESRFDGLVRSAMGEPYIAPETYIQMVMKLAPDHPEKLRAMVRGITPRSLLVHPDARLVEGRLPEMGRDEIIVGDLLASALGVPDERLAVGRTLWLDERDWTIVGRFEAPGTVMESEVWAPLTDAQTAARRDGLSMVTLTLGRGRFKDVDLFCKQRLDLELAALRETDYFAKLSAFYEPIRVMVWATALLIATGGLLGGLNTMYAAFASRIREIGTLQSLGFGRPAIVVSLLEESLLAACAGALGATALALGVLDGLVVSFSAGAFELVVDEGVLAVGLVAALLLGVVGAAVPAWRCLRMEIPDALRAA